MTRNLPLGKRHVVVMCTAGALAFVFGAVGGHPVLGFIALVVLSAIGLLALVPSELTTVSLAGADERQRRIFFESLFASDYLVRAVVAIGLMVEMYRGSPGPFALIAVVGATAEVLAWLVLPSRR